MKNFLFLFLPLVFWGCFSESSLAQTQTGMNYAKQWAEIDSFDRLGQYKTALEKTQSLYQKIGKEDLDKPAWQAEQIKAVLYVGKYSNMLEEDGFEKAIYSMREYMQQAKGSAQKALLQSILAEAYDKYMQGSIYKLRNLTATATTDKSNTDIQTWDIQRFVDEIYALHRAAISCTSCQNFSLKELGAVVVGANSPLYPSLYELLADRALKYFKSDKNYINQPAYRFYVEQEEALGSAEAFINYKFETKDSNSTHYQAILIYQQLLALHKGKNLDVFLYFNVERLQYLEGKSVLSNKEELVQASYNKLAEAHKEHEVWASLQYLKARYEAKKASNYQSGSNEEFRFAKKEALRIAQAGAKAYPKSRGGRLCQNFVQDLQAKNFSMRTEAILPSKEDILVSLKYQNVDTLYYFVAKIDHKKNFEDNEEQINYYKKQKRVEEQVLALPDDAGDMLEHSIEFALKGLDYGRYVLLVSSSKEYSSKKNALSFLQFQVSDISFWSRSREGRYEYWFRHRKTGEALSGIDVEFYTEQYSNLAKRYVEKKIAAVKTDSNGLVYSPERSDDSRSVYFRTKQAEDVFEPSESYWLGYARTADPGSTRMHFFTDRAIYRPGQTVYFKGIYYRYPSNKAYDPELLTNKSVSVIFRDVNGQEIETVLLTSNEYGSIQGSFTAPASGLTGNMSIEVGGAASRHSVRVEEYKRPKFQVAIKPAEGVYKLNSQVEVKGNAKAYSGQAIDGAELKYRVSRQVSFPYWRGGYWGYRPPYNTSTQEIAFGELKTDAEGNFTIAFTALPDKTIPESQLPVFSYTVNVDVSDATGETRSASSVVRVGAVAMNLGASLADRIDLRGKAPKLSIETKNLNAQALSAQVQVRIEALEEARTIYKKRYWSSPDFDYLSEKDYKQGFAQYAYKGEDDLSTRKVKNVVLEQSFASTGSLEVELPFEKLKPGRYRYTVSSQDSFGKKLEVQNYVLVYDSQAKKAPDKDIPLFLNTSFFKDCQPGQEIQIEFGSSEPSAHILFELEHRGELIEQIWYSSLEELKSYTLKLEEKHRGNVYFRLYCFLENRAYKEQGTIAVPWSNKELDIEFMSFRDKLKPGQEEEWQLKIKGPEGERIAAEVLASLYDASLDAFAPNNWTFSPHPNAWAKAGLSEGSNYTSNSAYYLLAENWNPNSLPVPSYPVASFNWHGFPLYSHQMSRPQMMPRSAMAPSDRSRSSTAPAPRVEEAQEKGSEAPEGDLLTLDDSDGPGETGTDAPEQVTVRRNLKETVFFFPELATDEEGNVIIKFTMNEALTSWKFQAFALSKELQTAIVQREIVTQKELMVQPNAPRFFRQGDTINFVAKVSNLSEQNLKGQASLQLFDAISMQPIDAAWANAKKEQDFEVEKERSTTLSWTLQVPSDWTNPITHRVIAKAGAFSDGEESATPVLSNRMLVTETMPLPVRGGEEKSFEFTRMKELQENSKTLKSHSYTLEFTQNPAWYALQALPYLMEYPYECTEQIFSRFYANSLASSVANSHPKIRNVFEVWKNQEPEALESKLMQNQELKYALLEETPWVLQAQSESQQRRNIGLLFDLNRMADEQSRAKEKLAERQLADGGFSWFPGGRANWYISQYIAEGMGHLNVMGVDVAADPKTGKLMAKTVHYIDGELAQHYKELKKFYKDKPEELEKDHLSHLAIHYLYTRSFYLQQPVSSPATQEAINYYEGQAQKYWLAKGLQGKAMLALALHRKGSDKATVDKLIKHFRESSLNSEEMGMYWKYPSGYYWHQLPIETHALMIEVFDVVAQDAKAVDDLKTWLLKAKQTTHWKTTKATAAACYALLGRGDNWLLEDKQIEISFGKKKLEIKAEEQQAGTGYFKKQWSASEITPNMASIKVKNPNKVVAWGAVYWQYFEQLDKITSFEQTPIKIKKQLYRQKQGDTGPVLEAINQDTKLYPGDLIKVRIELKVDRDMEYVHMKDARASGFEPANVLSSYKYQGALGYYESTRDAATNFFFSYLSKGAYVFEYPLRVQHAGKFSNGITTLQCMYAPEFTAHSEGIRVEVEEKKN